MSEHTHRVVGKRHRRSAGHEAVDASDGQTYAEYAVGDEITPTESELESFPYRFEEIPDDDADESAPADESDESPDESATPVSTDAIEDADYRELQSLASEYDDVRGDWSEDRLRSELLAKVEG